jgi:hypothetical protein
MTKQEEIIEGNKLIAEFMYPNAKEEYASGEIEIEDGLFKKGMLIFGHYDQMRYHMSWDWLMPVVEKIENIDIRNNGYDFPKVKFLGDCVEIFAYATYRGKTIYWKNWHSINGTNHPHVNQTDSKLKAVYIAVVEFIKWYNKNKNND